MTLRYISDFAQVLREKTQAGLVRWYQEGRDLYALDVDDKTLTISCNKRPPDAFGFDGQVGEDYVFSIIDSTGRTEKQILEPGEMANGPLQQLFAAAAKNATILDPPLQDLFERIQKMS